MDMCCFDDGNVVLGYEIATLQKEGTEAYLGNLPFPKIRRMVIPLNLEGVVSYFTIYGNKTMHFPCQTRTSFVKSIFHPFLYNTWSFSNVLNSVPYKEQMNSNYM